MAKLVDLLRILLYIGIFLYLGAAWASLGTTICHHSYSTLSKTTNQTNKQKLNPLKCELANYGWCAKFSPQPAFTYKVLLEYTQRHHIYLHTIYRGLLRAESSSCDRGCEAENSDQLVLIEKMCQPCAKMLWFRFLSAEVFLHLKDDAFQTGPGDKKPLEHLRKWKWQSHLMNSVKSLRIYLCFLLFSLCKKMPSFYTPEILIYMKILKIQETLCYLVTISWLFLSLIF